VEKIEPVPSKHPCFYTKRFGRPDRAGGESAARRRVAGSSDCPESTVRASIPPIWSGVRRSGAISAEADGRDESICAKRFKFITVVSNLETGEPLWFGRERKQETLDEFFRTLCTIVAASGTSRRHCGVDMGQPFTASITEWAPQCKSCTTSFTS